MATFIVEDGTGLSTANSLMSVADADAIIANYDNPSSWTDATTAVKENALRQATRYLNYNYIWDGAKTVSDQALQWPRVQTYDEDGLLIENDTIPQRVLEACAYLATQDVDGDSLIDDQQNEALVKKTKDVIGPITEEREYVHGEQPNKTYTVVDLLVAPFVIGDADGSEPFTVEVERG